MFHFLHTSFKDVENGKKIHQIRFDVLMVPAPKKELLNHLLDLDLNMVKRQRSPHYTTVRMAFRQDNKTSSTGFRKCRATGNVLSLASALVGFIWSDDRSNGGEKHVGMKSSALSNRYFIHIKKMSILASIFFIHVHKRRMVSN